MPAVMLVAELAERFRAQTQLVIGITPQGTRSGARQWKSGFAHIAQSAGVPVLPAIVNYAERVVFLQPVISASGSVQEILAATQAAAGVGSPRNP